MEQDSSSMEKRFSYKFLKRLLKYVDSAQEFIAHLGEFMAFLKHRLHYGALHWTLRMKKMYDSDLATQLVNPEAMATSGKTDKSPHDQEIKFFAKVWKSGFEMSHWNAVKFTLNIAFVEVVTSQLRFLSPGVAPTDGSNL